MQSIVQHACYSNAEVHGRQGLGPVIITNDTSRHWPCLAPFNHQCAPQTTETIATHSFHCLAALLLAHTLMNETFWLVDFILRSCVRRIRSIFLLFKVFSSKLMKHLLKSMFKVIQKLIVMDFCHEKGDD